jgi:hypothetical protein
MARLYADEDFDHAVVEELRGFGHDVLTVQEAGQANQAIPDEAVLAFATAQARAVLTHNRRHFIRLHRIGRVHAGILVCTRDRDAAALAARIDAALAQFPVRENQLIRINRPPAP